MIVGEGFTERDGVLGRACDQCGAWTKKADFAVSYCSGSVMPLPSCVFCQQEQHCDLCKSEHTRLTNKARRLAQAKLQHAHRAEYLRLLAECQDQFLKVKE